MRFHHCDRSDRIATLVILAAVFALAHLLDWVMTGHITFGFIGRG